MFSPADLQGQEILLDEVSVLAEALSIEIVVRRKDGVGKVFTGLFKALLMVVHAFELVDLVTELSSLLL